MTDQRLDVGLQIRGEGETLPERREEAHLVAFCGGEMKQQINVVRRHKLHLPSSLLPIPPSFGVTSFVLASMSCFLSPSSISGLSPSRPRLSHARTLRAEVTAPLSTQSKTHPRYLRFLWRSRYALMTCWIMSAAQFSIYSQWSRSEHARAIFVVLNGDRSQLG